MRRRLLVHILPAALLLAGCGGKFQLPTEHTVGKATVSDKSYAMLQTWKGMDGIQDILLTQGPYSQLFMLFNSSYPLASSPTNLMTGPDVARGYVRLFPFASQVPVDESYFPRPKTLFNPVALCTGPGSMYVLDEGDSCLAKFDVVRQTCEADPTPITPTSSPRPPIIWDYRSTWRVREYAYNLGAKFTGDTVTTFTDTSFTQVYGIAADPQGRVYVSGRATLILQASDTDTHVKERTDVPRIFRYVRGPKYTGLQPESANWDPNMPGCAGTWHRDTTWFVSQGNGTGYIWEPRGIAWSSYGSPSVFEADLGNGKTPLPHAATFSPNASNTGSVLFDGSESSPPNPLVAPVGAAADLQGYLYVADRGQPTGSTRTGGRVVRYDPFGAYVQDVNVELNSDGLPLLDPITVAVDDSVAYVGDRGRGQVIRYKRRP